MYLSCTSGGHKAERQENGVLHGWGGGLLLYLLGGDEEQLPSPLLFQALSSSYPTLSFSKTLVFHPPPAFLAPGSYEVLLQLCFRPRSWWTTKRVVTGQLQGSSKTSRPSFVCFQSAHSSTTLISSWTLPLTFHSSLPLSCFLSLRLTFHLFLMAEFLPGHLVTLPTYQQSLSFLIFLLTPAPYASSHRVFNLKLFIGIH